MMKESILHFAAAYLAGELVALLVFRVIRNKFAAKGTKIWTAIGKGLLERGMLLSGLAMNIQAIVTLYGAIKIGTRLKDANQDKVSNEYFLVGNFVSVTIALGEYMLYTLLQQQG